jgi:hypothetical protein
VTPEQRSRALELATVNLAWLTDEYRTYDQALTILADTRTRATIASGPGSGDGRRSVGSHSDPTGMAVTGGMADTDEQTDTLHERAGKMAKRMQRDVNWIAETAAEIHATVMRAMHDIEPPARTYTIEQALAHTRACTAPPRQTETLFAGRQPMRVNIAVSTLRQLDKAKEADELDDLIDAYARATSRLRSVVTRILYRATRPKDPPKPKQRARLTCQDCHRHGVQSDVAENSKTRCAKCLRFRKEYRCPPTSDIVRAWDNGRERLTPGMIAEAQAAVKGNAKAS